MPLLCGDVRTLQPYRGPVFVAITGLVGRVRAVAEGDYWIVSQPLGDYCDAACGDQCVPAGYGDGLYVPVSARRLCNDL
jgi:hypothetical protein